MNESNVKKRGIQAAIVPLVSFAVLAVIVYFAVMQFKIYQGQQALEKTGLTPLPLAQALARAKDQNKLVLADMSAIWCSTCQKLDKQVFASEAVQREINERFVYSRTEYDSEEGEAFMSRYGVSGFPTVLILDANGDMLSRVPLTFSPEIFVGYLSPR